MPAEEWNRDQREEAKDVAALGKFKPGFYMIRFAIAGQ
jgi:hypothetical protein